MTALRITLAFIGLSCLVSAFLLRPTPTHDLGRDVPLPFDAHDELAIVGPLLIFLADNVNTGRFEGDVPRYVLNGNEVTREELLRAFPWAKLPAAPTTTLTTPAGDPLITSGGGGAHAATTSSAASGLTELKRGPIPEKQP